MYVCVELWMLPSMGEARSKNQPHQVSLLPKEKVRQSPWVSKSLHSQGSDIMLMPALVCPSSKTKELRTLNAVLRR